MAYKLAEEDKLCGVIYPTYEGFSPIPKATCEMLESKCDKTEIIVKCKDNQSEEDKKPEPDEIPADMSRNDLTTTLNLHYLFGQAVFDGDTLIHVWNSDRGELTKEDFTKFEEYVNKKSENILNKGISGTHKYHAKAELRQDSKEGAIVFTQKEVNIFSLNILVTQPSGSNYLIEEPVTTAIIDNL